MPICRVQVVESLDTSDLAIYQTLKRVEAHERAGILVAANHKTVRRLLQSRFGVVSALLTPEWLEQLGPLLRGRSENISVYVAAPKLLERITGYQMHQGALAVAKIPPRPTFETLWESSPAPRLIAAVEGIASAENLGAIVRNCAAFGAHFLLVGETCGSPYQRRAVAASVGAIFEQSVLPVERLVEQLKILRARGVCCLAAHPRPGARPLAATDLRGDCCLVFGAEGPGLSSAAVEACDGTVEIPMPSSAHSLNVATAAAIFLYEANRQRKPLS